MSFVFALALAAGQIVPGPAPTAGFTPGPIGDEAADARCLAVFAQLSQSKQIPENQAQIGAIYFAGKIFGRNASVDLVSIMKPAVAQVKSNMAAEAQRCGAEMQVAGDRITKAGDQLTSQGY